MRFVSFRCCDYLLAKWTNTIPDLAVSLISMEVSFRQKFSSRLSSVSTIIDIWNSSLAPSISPQLDSKKKGDSALTLVQRIAYTVFGAQVEKNCNSTFFPYLFDSTNFIPKRSPHDPTTFFYVFELLFNVICAPFVLRLHSFSRNKNRSDTDTIVTPSSVLTRVAFDFDNPIPHLR